MLIDVGLGCGSGLNSGASANYGRWVPASLPALTGLCGAAGIMATATPEKCCRPKRTITKIYPNKMLRNKRLPLLTSFDPLDSLDPLGLFDLRDLENDDDRDVARAMYEIPTTLFDKTASIWRTSCYMIRIAEQRHSEFLRKFWQSDAEIAFSAQSVSARAPIAERRGLFHQDYDHSFAFAYFGVIHDVHRIKRALHPDCLSASDAETGELLYQELKKESPHHVLNKVMPYFFSLQLHCYHMIRTVRSPTGILPDPLVKRSGSVAGGKAANVGEVELKTDVMNLFHSLEGKEKFSSVTALSNELSNELDEILTRYQARVNTGARRRDGAMLTYGRDLTLEGLIRKINQWKRADSEFKAALERICVIRARNQ